LLVIATALALTVHSAGASAASDAIYTTTNNGTDFATIDPSSAVAAGASRTASD
jgi:hypothetical protein